MVVTAISAGLVLFLGLLYRNLLFTGEALQSAESDWKLENFLRMQLAFRDERFDRLGLFHGASHELRFVSLYSARYLADGPPVYVRYRFDPNSGRLEYRETDMLPWWQDDISIQSFELTLLSEMDVNGWSEVVMSELQTFQWSFFDFERGAWQNDWALEDQAPLLLRLDFQRVGKPFQWQMATRSLRFPAAETIDLQADDS